jgi:iron complex transport system ATP-binding protein
MCLLQASNLTFAYGERPVLREVSIKLSPGEVVTLLGPNGCGKSTLIKILLGHLRGSGAIEWDGRPLPRWRRRAFARRVAYLPQAPSFEVEHRVLDVLQLGRAPYWQAFGIESPHDAEVVARVAEQLDLTPLLHRRLEELSGGQRQRVFIGRCLAQEPGAMLLDEPSTFLDLRHQVELCELLRRLAREQKIAVLMASHDLNLAALYADRLMLLAEGKMVAAGAQDDVLDPQKLSEVYGVAIERIDRGHGVAPAVLPVVRPL